MGLFNFQVEVGTDGCRATGAGTCLMSVHVRQKPADGPAKAGHYENQGA